MPNQNSGDFSGLGGIGPALRRAVEQNGIGENLRPHQAIALWAEIAGEQIASVAQAEAVRGKVLFVRAKSSAWANELTFYKPDILKRMNLKLGGAVIKDIHFSTGSKSSSSSASDPKPPTVEVRDLSRIADQAAPLINLTDEAKIKAQIARTRSVLEWKRANGWAECSRCQALFEPISGRAKPKAPSRSKRTTANLCPMCVAMR